MAFVMDWIQSEKMKITLLKASLFLKINFQCPNFVNQNRMKLGGGKGTKPDGQVKCHFNYCERI